MSDPTPKCSAPQRYCDLVMKGGITSGVVYPRAVTEIAAGFTLKSVGGTSAGAIAAAAAAAAEFGRQRGSVTEFKMLADLPGFLEYVNASGHTNLFTFFQPQPGTRRLFYVLTAALNAASGAQMTWRIGRALVCQYRWAALAGAVPGALLALLAWRSHAGPLSMITFLIGLGFAMLGLLLLPAIEALIAFGHRVPENLFGLCSGMPGATRAGRHPADAPKHSGTALAVWLTRYLNELAGCEADGAPLTFGQLWSPTTPRGQRPPEDFREIKLEMLSTCLTWGRPFRLPFQDDAEVKENVFYFRVSEFKRLFPENVMTWLCADPRESRLPDKWRWKPERQPEEPDYLPLPDPHNLPVVIATRMSLSFPILLSAVPLYAYPQDLEGEARAAQPPARCWFSDGGICSNFPMHFFDSPLPRWPTFAINLAAKPEGTPAAELAQPWMPKNNKEGIQETWNGFDAAGGLASVFRFVGAIVGTMQNWSDNSLLRLPGYRDRIAHVGLTPAEGGLNLDMPKERISDLGDRGAAAGREFVRRFASGEEETMNWENHRFIRLRSLLAEHEEFVRKIERACAEPKSGDIGYEDWVRVPDCGVSSRYKWTDKQRQLALTVLRGLRELSRKPLEAPATLMKDAPRPRPEIRLRPRL